MNAPGKLNARAMLVSLNISLWTARKLDKRITAEVNTQHNASNDAGRYNKHLLPGDARSYDTLRKAAQAARDTYYTQTLPWSADGARILPAMNFMEFSAQMRKHRAEYDAALADFLADYPSLQANARVLLNGMFNPADYPAPGDLAGRFGFALNFSPVPDAGDFRVDIADDAAATIRQQIEKNAREAEARAMRDLWDRLHDATAAMVDRLSQPDAIFRDSLIGNMRELLAILPRLNISNDPALAALADEADRKLAAYHPQDLRDDKATRAAVAADAAAIMDKMRDFMGTM